ncbi:MAG: hypothetical protein R3F29_09435 [Planctomycetota bacterium]
MIDKNRRKQLGWIVGSEGAPPFYTVSPAGVAIASSGCHVGEVLQGVVAGERCLASFTFDAPRTIAMFEPNDSGIVSVHPGSKRKSARAAEEVLARFGPPGRGGRLGVFGSLHEGIGLGSSSSEIDASSIATASAVGVTLDAQQRAEIMLTVDGATDPLMLPDHALLYAHRRAATIHDYGRWPSLEVIVVDTAAGTGGVDTATFSLPDYTESELRAFGMLESLLGHAIADGDVELLGTVATSSARINQRFLPKPRFEELVDIGKDHSAAGLVAAHTGTAVGWIFPRIHGRTVGDVAGLLSRLEALDLPPIDRLCK